MKREPPLERGLTWRLRDYFLATSRREPLERVWLQEVPTKFRPVMQLNPGNSISKSGGGD